MYKVSFTILFYSFFAFASHDQKVPDMQSVCEAILAAKDESPHELVYNQLRAFRNLFSHSPVSETPQFEPVAYGVETSSAIVSSDAKMAGRLDTLLGVLKKDLSTTVETLDMDTSKGLGALVHVDNDPRRILTRVNSILTKASQSEGVYPSSERTTLKMSHKSLVVGNLIGLVASAAIPFAYEAPADVWEHLNQWIVTGASATSIGSASGAGLDFWNYFRALKKQSDDIPEHLQGKERFQEIAGLIQTQVVMRDHNVYLGLNYTDAENRERHLDIHFFIFRMRPYLVRVEW